MTRALGFGIKRIASILGGIVLIVSSDQLTKVWARDSVPATVQSYAWDLIRLQYVENSGAFLGLGSALSESVRFWILTVLVSIGLGFAIWILLRPPKHEQNPIATFSLTMLVAGGLSNQIDRFQKGTVTDFLNIGVGELRTGIFNIADMAILLGAILLMIWVARGSDDRSSRPSKGP